MSGANCRTYKYSIQKICINMHLRISQFEIISTCFFLFSSCFFQQLDGFCLLCVPSSMTQRRAEKQWSEDQSTRSYLTYGPTVTKHCTLNLDKIKCLMPCSATARPWRPHHLTFRPHDAFFFRQQQLPKRKRPASRQTTVHGKKRFCYTNKIIC